MRGSRVLFWLRRMLGAMPVWLSGLGLAAACFLDRGTGRAPRVSLFPLALTAFDPLAWDSLSNSVIMAVLVTACALLLGVPLARATARTDAAWPRRALALIALAPAVLPPLFSALGVRMLMGTEALNPSTPTRFSIWEPWNARIGGVWLAWFWVELAFATPLVALAVARVLARLGPAWEDAGRALGAKPRRVWRDLRWPLARPVAVRAAAVVFGLVLFEPGAPLILGLRRSLAFQIVEAVSEGDRALPARAAVLTIMGLALTLVVRWLTVLQADFPLPQHLPTRSTRRARASWRSAVLAVSFLLIWCISAGFPFLGLIAHLGPIESCTPEAALQRLKIALGNLETARLVGGLAIGGLTAAIALLLAWLATRSVAAARLGRLLGVTPPLAIAVGYALLPGVLDHWRPTAPFAVLLDPPRAPGVLLVLVLVLTHWPIALHAAGMVRARCRPEFVEAAMTLGASRRRAHWDISRPSAVPVLIRAGLLITASAAGSLVAAVVLAPTVRPATWGLDVLNLADQPGELTNAALLAALSSASMLVTFAITFRDEPPLGADTAGP